MKKMLIGLMVVTGLLGMSAQAQNSADVALGAKLYDEHCAQCHDNSVHQLNDNGPALFGVYGRRVGSIDGFEFSPSLVAAEKNGHVWTRSRLDKFLTNPTKMYPGTSMPMSFSSAHNRRAIIAYIKTLK